MKKGSEKAEMQKLKLKLKQKLVTRVKENILNVQKNAKVTNGNSNADAELHNEVYDDTQIEAMSLELINILSDAYYGNAKCISYSCDKGNFTTDNGIKKKIPKITLTVFLQQRVLTKPICLLITTEVIQEYMNPWLPQQLCWQ